jgi:hypothetical protein
MSYRYDLHCHTREGSKCSDMSISGIVDLYRENDYAGICITDHFTNPMNPLPDDAPWSERVMLSYDIYRKVKVEGERCGLHVFFGIEYSLTPDIEHPSKATGTDLLFLNLEVGWLMENKDAFRGETRDLCACIRNAGGYIIHAHPMLGEELRLFPHCVDAVEVINGGVTKACNDNAKAYAQMYGLVEIAGTDIQRYDQQTMAGMETDTPCTTIEELVSAIKTGHAKPFSFVREISEHWKKMQEDASEHRKTLRT